MSVTIQLRGDTLANWTAANPILAEREIGIVKDDNTYKIGDGVTPWNSLPFKQLTGVIWDSITMNAIDNPSTPSPGTIGFYAHNVGGRIFPKWIGPSGLDNNLQSALFGNGLVTFTPSGTTALTAFGNPTPTVVGTLSHPAIATGLSLRQAIRRGIITSAATANSASELRTTTALTYRGEVFGDVEVGGFFAVTRFGISSATANQRVFVGFNNSGSATSTTQTPSLLANCFFVGWDSTDTNLQVMHNDASGTCTKIDLGPNFPANNINAIYESVFFCKPNGEEIGYRVTRLDTNNRVSGTLVTDIPAKTTQLFWHAYVNNGGTAAAVILDFYRFYLETDY